TRSTSRRLGSLRGLLTWSPMIGGRRTGQRRTGGAGPTMWGRSTGNAGGGSRMRQHLVLAGDVGGTRSRLVAASVGGGLLAQVEGPGANLRSSGPAAFDTLAATIAEVLEQARLALRAADADVDD